MAAGSVARAVVAFVVLAALQVPGAVARHGSDLLDIPGAEFISVNTLPFGFEAGGSVFVSAAYPAGVSNYNPVQFMFCSFADRNKLLRNHGSIVSLCGADLTHVCEWSARLDSNSTVVAFNGTAATTDLYEFLALNCMASAVEVEVAYKYVNPGGEHLSTTMIPFKPMSLALACIWGTISVAWCINYALNRRFANVLFLSIGLIPFLTGIQCMLSYMYWTKLSATGNADILMLLLVILLSGLCHTLLMSVLVIVSKGWHITRLRLPPDDWKLVGMLAVIFMISLVTLEIFSGFFFLFLIIVVYVIVLRFLFVSVSGTLEVVSFQTRYLRARNPGAPVGSLLPERQYKALRLFRSVLPVFIIVLILMRVWSMMALQRSPWAETALSSGFTVALAVFLIVMFRLRRRSLYYENAFAQPLLGGADVEPPPVVIVHNPDTTTADGRVVVSMSVGIPCGDAPACGGEAGYVGVEVPNAGGGDVVEAGTTYARGRNGYASLDDLADL